MQLEYRSWLGYEADMFMKCISKGVEVERGMIPSSTTILATFTIRGFRIYDARLGKYAMLTI